MAAGDSSSTTAPAPVPHAPAVAPVKVQSNVKIEPTEDVPIIQPQPALVQTVTPTATPMPQPSPVVVQQQQQQQVLPLTASQPIPVSNPLASSQPLTTTQPLTTVTTPLLSAATTATATATPIVTTTTTSTSTGIPHPVHLPLMQPSYLLDTSLQPVSVVPPMSAAPTGATPNHNTVAEFLYQLTKMLTDDNREVIEWSNGKIEVHNPPKLASDVLHKYFRHSKYSSFQRQLNYFGFRKLAGKGKMAPCSYVNDAATADLRSLLSIKRKTSGSTPSGRKRDNAASQDTKTNATPTDHTAAATTQAQPLTTPPVNPVLAGILSSSSSLVSNKRPRTENDLAVKVAVGKGVKHKLNGYLKGPAAATSTWNNATADTATATNPSVVPAPNSNDHVSIAKSAVGKGIPHRILRGPGGQQGDGATATSSNVATVPPETTESIPTLSSTDSLGALVPGIEDSLSELTKNFQNSVNEYNSSIPTVIPSAAEVSTDQTGTVATTSTPANAETTATTTTATASAATPTAVPSNSVNNPTSSTSIKRESSLTDLAMIPPLYSVDPTPVSELYSSSIMGFVDFPNSEIDPTKNAPDGFPS